MLMLIIRHSYFFVYHLATQFNKKVNLMANHIEQIQKIKLLIPYVFFSQIQEKLKNSANFRKQKLGGEDIWKMMALREWENADGQMKSYLQERFQNHYKTNIYNLNHIYKKSEEEFQKICKENPTWEKNEVFETLLSQHTQNSKEGICKTITCPPDPSDPFGQSDNFPYLTLTLYDNTQMKQWSHTWYQIDLTLQDKKELEIKVALIQPYETFGWQPSSSVIAIYRGVNYVKSEVSGTIEEARILNAGTIPLHPQQENKTTIYVLVGHQKLKLPCYLKLTNLNKESIKYIISSPKMDLIEKIHLMNKIFNKIPEQQIQEDKDVNPESLRKKCLVKIQFKSQSLLKPIVRLSVPDKYLDLVNCLYSIDSPQKKYKYMLMIIHPITIMWVPIKEQQ